MSDRTSDAPGMTIDEAIQRDARFAGTPSTSGAAAVVNVARRALELPASHWHYAQVRPFTTNLFGGGVVTSDCSGFAISCYMLAGLPNPSGGPYDGTGFTGTLEAHGWSVDHPDPGYLAFWSSPDHVAVCINGGGDIIEFGGPPAPIRYTIDGENAYHASFLGYRAYIGKGQTGSITPIAGGTPAPPSLPEGQYDWAPMVVNSGQDISWYGGHAMNNAGYVEKLLMNARYCDTEGVR